MEEFDPGPSPLLLVGATQSSFARILASVGLVALAGWFFLQRYALLMNQHAFMTGVDFLDENVTLPLRWVVVVAAFVAIPLVLTSRWKFVIAVLAAAFAANAVTPAIVRAVYVRPNELVLEKPYIERHIEATSAAFGLSQRSSEQPFGGSQQESLDVKEHATLVDNIRLWDWRAFSDTITQIQALRPYYRFADVDIDRYTINGKIKQVLLSPREIDVNELSVEARQLDQPALVLHARLRRGDVGGQCTTDDGLPVLLIQDAPPEIKIPDIKLNRRKSITAKRPTIRFSSAPIRTNSITPRATRTHVELRGHGRLPDRLVVVAADGLDRARRLQHLAHRLHERRQPHDALSQCLAASRPYRRLYRMGTGSVLVHHRGRPAVVDCRRLYYLRRPPLLDACAAFGARPAVQLHPQLGQGHHRRL